MKTAHKSFFFLISFLLLNILTLRESLQKIRKKKRASGAYARGGGALCVFAALRYSRSVISGLRRCVAPHQRNAYIVNFIPRVDAAAACIFFIIINLVII